MRQQPLSRDALASVKSYDEFFGLCQTLRNVDEKELFELLFPIVLSGNFDPASSVAGCALIELEPRCPISCGEAIEKIGTSTWDLSNRELPFYLVSQFGKWAVREAVQAYLQRPNEDEQKRVLVNGVWYWASGPSAKLAENLFYWEWREAIEGKNA